MLFRPLTDSLEVLEVTQNENQRPSKRFLCLSVIIALVLLSIIIVGIMLLQTRRIDNSLHICVLEDPCDNNGSCIDGGSMTYVCKCITGWTGINCTQPVKVLLIGGMGYPERLSMEYYYPYQPQHNSLVTVNMLKPRSHHISVVTSDGKVMTIGGLYKFRETNNVEVFDPISNKVTQGVNMDEKIFYCDGAILKGIVYVCGGKVYGQGVLSNCDSYRSDAWNSIAPMQQARLLLRLISLNGYLYAIGGVDENDNVLNSVEKYNPDSNIWAYVQSMKTPRRRHGAAVLNGFIYVCGGLFTHSCERYDPELNAWSNKTQTIFYRTGLQMVSDADHLFAIGGWNTFGSVEMYDPKKDNWTQLKPSIREREHSSAVMLH